jgi:alpha-L-fucosidase
MGPRRGVLGGLAAAIRRQGLTFGLSSHRAEHWWCMNGGRAFLSDLVDVVSKNGTPITRTAREGPLASPSPPADGQPPAPVHQDGVLASWPPGRSPTAGDANG